MYILVRLKKNKIIAFLLSITILLSAVFVVSVKAQSQIVQLPIIMYHSILKDSKYWGDYVISPDELEEDMKFLSQNGYTAIGVEDLNNYIEKGIELPEKPIILSFDDGYYNNYVYAFPLAQKYKMKIVISPIAYYSDINQKGEKLSPYYSHCTWEQIKEMYNSNLVEFGNHSYNLHSSSGARLGTAKVNGEDESKYQQLLLEDLTKAQNLLTKAIDQETKLFVYPFGAISKESKIVIDKMKFSVCFSCEEKTNLISRDSESIKLLGRYLRPYNKNISQILGGN